MKLAVMTSYQNKTIEVTLWRNYDFVKKELLEPTKAIIPLSDTMPEIIICEGIVYKQIKNPEISLMDNNYLYEWKVAKAEVKTGKEDIPY